MRASTPPAASHSIPSPDIPQQQESRTVPSIAPVSGTPQSGCWAGQPRGRDLSNGNGILPISLCPTSTPGGDISWPPACPLRSTTPGSGRMQGLAVPGAGDHISMKARPESPRLGWAWPERAEHGAALQCIQAARGPGTQMCCSPGQGWPAPRHPPQKHQIKALQMCSPTCWPGVGGEEWGAQWPAWG